MLRMLKQAGIIGDVAVLGNELMNDYGHKAYRKMNWKRQYTFDEYMNLPDPLKRLELHEGHLYLRPLEYASIVQLRTRICDVLEAIVGDTSAFCAPSHAFQPPGNNLWVAGIGLVSKERWNTAVTEDEYLRLAPELVVEIVWEERPMDGRQQRLSLPRLEN